MSVRALLVGLLLCIPVAQADTLPDFATEDERNTIEIFEYASPSVVYVTNQQLVRDPRSFNLQTVPRGAGTGFVWNEDGYIVTNFHVIEGARQIIITLPDQSTWPAKVVGLAPERDLAVLRIDAPEKQLHPLLRGDSSKLSVGHKVLAIGNPFGLDATLTTGVVSALGREIDAPNRRRIRNVIQTDAAINPGNSGGPLLNSRGELVGVNTMIFSPSGASAGIGFAIPVNTVKDIVPQLIEHGRIVRPVIGIDIAPDHWAQRIGIQGVPILRVAEGMPADKAGLQGVQRNRRGATILGDVITAIDDHATRNYDELMTALERYNAGDEIRLTFIREGKTLQRTLTLAAPE
ncbi:S1C family serine protease [Marinimicrobium sp. ABcell2]|uniref:S1C family serine protease n=1 Tax=Marinimicrobium sp. ABcell2 TaxID=3069751 RepID=UPI0027B3E80A|nr:trypsin-like peptidase domain-containing protein [Marinimicrobium sp. ABcell2]MDQ2077681.1 trypsin-like peptidase domain-containing protein [Marinimicrobium sp. ABcell2]